MVSVEFSMGLPVETRLNHTALQGSACVASNLLYFGTQQKTPVGPELKDTCDTFTHDFFPSNELFRGLKFCFIADIKKST